MGAVGDYFGPPSTPLDLTVTDSFYQWLFRPAEAGVLNDPNFGPGVTGGRPGAGSQFFNDLGKLGAFNLLLGMRDNENLSRYFDTDRLGHSAAAQAAANYSQSQGGIGAAGWNLSRVTDAVAKAFAQAPARMVSEATTYEPGGLAHQADPVGVVLTDARRTYVDPITNTIREAMQAITPAGMDPRVMLVVVAAAIVLLFLLVLAR